MVGSQDPIDRPRRDHCINFPHTVDIIAIEKKFRKMDQHGDQTDTKKSAEMANSSDYAPYPKLDYEDITLPATLTPPPPPPTNPETGSVNHAATMPPQSNPYVSTAPAPPSSVKDRVDSLRDTVGKWGKKVGEATKRAEDLAGGVWQHLKTAPSVTDAAMGRIAQSTKVLAEGGYEKIFQRTFETTPEEQLQNSFACYLSTSAGPVMGILYLSTAKLAFSSDSPLSYKEGDKTEWSFYKVVIPLPQLKAVNTSTNNVNPAEKYIQVVSSDNHEFWFMGFVNYNEAVKSLQEAQRTRNLDC